jgi:hypothetical protein
MGKTGKDDHYLIRLLCQTPPGASIASNATTAGSRYTFLRVDLRGTGNWECKWIIEAVSAMRVSTGLLLWVDLLGGLLSNSGNRDTGDR